MKNNINEWNACSKHYSRCDDVLLYARRVVISEAILHLIMKGFHLGDSGMLAVCVKN